MLTRKGDANIYEVDLLKQRLELYVGKPDTLTNLLKKTGARAAINGSFFNMSDGSLLTATFANGKKHRERGMGGHVLFKNKQGQYGIHSFATGQWLGAIEGSILWGLEGGPLVTRDGKSVLEYTNVPGSIVNYLHPRTAVGLTGNKMHLVVVNGRRFGRGMTCKELGQFGTKEGYKFFLMYDGGGSSEMVIRNNDGTISIVYKPSDGRERAVPTALLVYDIDAPEVNQPVAPADRRPVLKIGSRGTAAWELQTILNNSMFVCAVDGVFGLKTEQLVKAFQLSCGLKADGIVGPLTWDMLDLWGLHKSSGKQLSEHFKDTEFMCRDGSWLVRVHPQLLKKLESLRDYLKVPIIIVSGYRTVAYNKKVGGEMNSYHLRGMAADIKVPGYTPQQVADVARKLGFGGIGIYVAFTHIDVGPTRAWVG